MKVELSKSGLAELNELLGNLLQLTFMDDAYLGRLTKLEDRLEESYQIACNYEVII